MTKLLLILVLFSDPTGEKAAQALHTQLGTGGTRVVLVGGQARDELAKRQLVESDCDSPSTKVLAATQDRSVIIVRFTSRPADGSTVLDTRVFMGGRCEGHTAIGGSDGGTPVETLPAAAAAAAIRILAPSVATGPAAIETEPTLAASSRRAAWQEIVDTVSGRTERSPRAWWFLIMAHCRLGRIEDAKTALAAFTTAHPGDPLLARAAELIAAAGASLAPPSSDPGGDTLR